MGWRKFCSVASHPYGKQYKGSPQEAAQNILDQNFLYPAIPTNYNLTTSAQPPATPFSPLRNLGGNRTSSFRQSSSPLQQVPAHKVLPGFLVNRKYSLIAERRKRPAAGLLLLSYFTPTDNREGAGETYDSEADLSSGVHQQPERQTAWQYVLMLSY
ncbi:hypothetical protein AVEN_186299-1 [Araneus ventricosus]|uniref:Uncharacterized protein n=1 Tax=Araneus ventricosus TaxID=182803 RepID=A0A4Y2M6G6_ARAVE|nr:hypothetical protein AVEN_186299-1 [Araneus ventricosus]